MSWTVSPIAVATWARKRSLSHPDRAIPTTGMSRVPDSAMW